MFKKGDSRYLNPLQLHAVLLSAVLNQLFFPSACLAEEWQFKVNGKEVSRNVYDAALLVTEATRLIKSNCTERAVSKLKRAILLAPDLPEPHTNLAVLLARQGHLSEAKKHLLKAVRAKEPPAMAFLDLATLYQTTGEIDKAISNYEIYIKLSGDKSTDAAVALLKTELDRRVIGKNVQQGDYLDQCNYRGGVRWADSRMPLKVYIDPASDPPAGYKEEYANMLRQSFYEWSKAAGNTIRFNFTNDKNRADIKCYWTNEARYLGGGAEAGETRFKCMGKAMVEANIYLRTKEEDGVFPYTDNDVQGTCLHEIGHALGISGHSLKASDIMFFSTPFAETERHISNRDKTTLVRLYAMPLDLWSSVLDFISNPETYSKWGILGIGAGIFMIPLVVWICSSSKKKRKGKNKKKR